MMWWRAEAACATDPDAMFVKGAAQHDAKRVCVGCPVRPECLTEALENQIERGVWGGLTERERRKIQRQSRKAVA